MLKRHAENRMQIEMVSMEELVPGDHLLRKIDGAVDFSYILELVSGYYDAEAGRPSADPVGAVQAGIVAASIRHEITTRYLV